MTIYGVYNRHQGYWRIRGIVWHTEHLNLAYAQSDRACRQSGTKSWGVCEIGKYGRPTELEERLEE